MARRLERYVGYSGFRSERIGPLFDSSENRIQNIAHFNGIEGQGVGYFVSFSASFINHSYVYYNDVSGCVTLHALRQIAQGEEITISYFQENPYQTKNERNQQLAKYGFACDCVACGSSESDERRRFMMELRRRLITYNQNNNTSEESHYQAMANLRELVTCMEEETMESLELSLCYPEQARILSSEMSEPGATKPERPCSYACYAWLWTMRAPSISHFRSTSDRIQGTM
ncbi:hypothetical protein DL764_005367 [Monosporascus ibericus]|uniref:SET domain-containing protein n=1 Tax=Monosporascus ibericus TaxID=155417 RepID=A0A4Q4T994_9PEZI|nr:hypothetical protein DL764_005367 [Monosporascus ibericus]